MAKNVLKEQQTGFTLLEVLIGMSILSIMMLLLFASLRICVQNWNAGEEKITQVSQAAVIQHFLQSKLQATLPLDNVFLKEKQFSFQGDEEFIQFVASMPISAKRLGLQLFKMTVEKSANKEEGNYLLVDIKPFFPQSEGEIWNTEQVVILKKIQALHFSYFGSDTMNSEPIWQNKWINKYSLPDLVKIDIELTDGEIWPQIIVALKVNATANNGAGTSQNPFGIRNGKFISP